MSAQDLYTHSTKEHSGALLRTTLYYSSITWIWIGRADRWGDLLRREAVLNPK